MQSHLNNSGQINSSVLSFASKEAAPVPLITLSLSVGLLLKISPVECGGTGRRMVSSRPAWAT
jgi:hypothetical protein